MASLEKRDDGWRVRWRDPDGTPRSRQCPTKGAAQKLKAEVEECCALGRRWEPRDAREVPDLRRLLRDYAEECARVLKPNTAIRYARALDLFLRYLDRVHGKTAALPPSLLTRRLLADWYADLQHGGLHGRDRSAATRRKLVEVVQLAWAWLYDDAEHGPLFSAPRKLRMAREPARPTVAPTWAEMDACIGVLNGWHQRLAIVLRFTGLRCQQAMGLRWTDLDLDRARLTIRGELGKSRQEQRGRIVPISAHLVAIFRTWERTDEWLISSNRQRGGERERMARARDLERGWERSGVRREAWDGRPHHAFRKGFVSELKRAGADADAVEFLVGHSLGLRGVYIDPEALPLTAAINHIPVLKPAPAPTFEGGADLYDTQAPVRDIFLSQKHERGAGNPRAPRSQPVCPRCALEAHPPRGARPGSRPVKQAEQLEGRKNGGGGGSRTHAWREVFATYLVSTQAP